MRANAYADPGHNPLRIPQRLIPSLDRAASQGGGESKAQFTMRDDVGTIIGVARHTSAATSDDWRHQRVRPLSFALYLIHRRFSHLRLTFFVQNLRQCLHVTSFDWLVRFGFRAARHHER